MSKIELTFNWFYADNENIALFSSGRVPVRAAGVDLGLPTIGTGGYEWSGFYTAAQHPQAVNPSGGRILNWNNKPAAGWTAADDEWALRLGPPRRAPRERGRAQRARSRSARWWPR